MYGSADVEVPPNPSKRTNTGRTTALVGGLLFASAALALSAARGGFALFGSASLASEPNWNLNTSVHHDDEYHPNEPIHPADDPDDDGTGAVPVQTPDGDGADHGWADETVYIDLREYSWVAEFLAERNITGETPEEAVLDYVPTLKLRYNQKRAAGDLGSQALSGYVVMCLDASTVSNDYTMTRTASLMLVLSQTGEVMAVRPTPGYGSMGIQPVQMNALKMRDPHNVLLGANLETNYGRGPLMLWNWQGNFFEVLGNGTFGLGTYTSHDLQYVSSHTYDVHVRQYFNGSSDDDVVTPHVGGGQARVFRPSTTLNLIFAEDVVTGDLQRTIGPFDYARTSDMNHFQILENGIVIVNGRSSGSWRKYDMKTGSTHWTCGGAFGNFTTIDLDGTVVKSGVDYHQHNETPVFLWYGQHNLEYFGENEWFMFNNAYNQRAGEFLSTTSRPMKVVLDETKMIANITWAYETGVRSYIYGDVDRLPTGHLLACWWPSELSVNMPEQYDTKVAEIIPDYSNAGKDELAWELLVIGHNCTFGHKGREDGTGCTRASSGDTVPFGWSLYSVEKFYLAPLATHAQLNAYDSTGQVSTLCMDTETNPNVMLSQKSSLDEGAKMMLEFETYDSFKSNLPSTGKWWLKSDDMVLATEEIVFKPHWRAKKVEFNLTFTAGDLDDSASWSLVIQDAWGFDNRTVALSC